ncbi:MULTISPECIES: HlyD family efflux transporter periplasmic adaptor subunit [unclassified Psychrobacter]|uniref:HlyD family efflux transporter periplasmic adaptor subunit n=1 Tax=unclassified Psychrobacter TaxID=196806 RepID=UPI00086AA419|nr:MULTISPECIES: HlyD family efflux transporter periplasmic adaptor subunit [unclassified Psychrobacter]OEH66928.1 MAG: secretion protein [Psychrobacter sp. B29-1]PKG65365.1 secretion protein [Psychrobacter sp. Choline-02u-13]PKH55131.1 secretion protein [Psychrobacter sp. Choline-02u-9]TEW88092.1 HlyD family efflux transporter periplasmic adaptor subunit [Psychrobacter sp. 230]|tara:strand:- start:19773 stop:20942 length:1170 start_codon:yes stop_codon:yes gene_type:complete
MSEYKYTPTKPQVNRSRLSIWIALIGIVILIVWASFAKIDQVTRAQATVIASARTQEIQASEGGILTQLAVTEGEEVKAGQLLVVLEEERAKAAVDNSASKTAALTAKLARLNAEIFEKPLVFPKGVQDYPEYVQNQRALYNRRRQAINEEVSSLEKMLVLARQELRMNEPLLKYGDVSQADVIKLSRQVADIEAQINNKRNKYFEEAQAEMTKAQEELDTELEQLRDRAQVLEEKRLMAPTEGKIKNINVTTIGGVVKPGEVIMQILPTSSDLVIDAKVSPADIAYVKEGQEATVKLDAYDYSIFGAMKGTVNYISPDTLMEQTPKGEEPYYRVLIVINGAEFKGRGDEIVIKPGMTASVDIKAMERTVLSYLTKPITKTLSEGLGER